MRKSYPLDEFIKIRTTSYLKRKGLSVEAGYVRASDINKVFMIPVSKVKSDHGCVMKDNLPKYPVEELLFFVIRCMDRGVKIQEKREALVEFLDYIGVPHTPVWDTKLYLVYHSETNKVKIGVTDTEGGLRLREIIRYHKGDMKDQSDMRIIFMMDVEEHPIRFENFVKEQFAELHTDAPSNTEHAVGKGEWYHFSDAFVEFVNEREHLNQVKQTEVDQVDPDYAQLFVGR